MHVHDLSVPQLVRAVHNEPGNEILCNPFMSDSYSDFMLSVFQHLGWHNGNFQGCHNFSGIAFDKLLMPKVA